MKEISSPISDTLSHQHISEKLGNFLLKKLIKKWLEARYFENNIFHKIQASTPQREIISPSLSLSLPGIHENVQRANRIHVHYMDENFIEHDEWVDGYVARVMQHEFDHLEGKMFIDHLSPLRKQLIRGKLNTMLKGKARSSYKMKQVKR